MEGVHNNFNALHAPTGGPSDETTARSEQTIFRWFERQDEFDKKAETKSTTGRMSKVIGSIKRSFSSLFAKLKTVRVPPTSGAGSNAAAQYTGQDETPLSPSEAKEESEKDDEDSQSLSPFDDLSAEEASLLGQLDSLAFEFEKIDKSSSISVGIITGRNKFMSGAGCDDDILIGSSGDKAKINSMVELINSNHVSFAAHLSLLAEDFYATPYFKAACLAVESMNEDEIRLFQTDLEYKMGVKPLARICMHQLWEVSSAGKGKIKFGTEALEQWKALTPNLVATAPTSPMTFLKNSINELDQTLLYYEMQHLADNAVKVELIRSTLKAAEEINSNLTQISKEIAKVFPPSAKRVPGWTDVMGVAIATPENQSWNASDVKKGKTMGDSDQMERGRGRSRERSKSRDPAARRLYLSHKQGKGPSDELANSAGEMKATPETRTCNICWKPGHLSYDCPEKKLGKGGDKGSGKGGGKGSGKSGGKGGKGKSNKGYERSNAANGSAEESPDDIHMNLVRNGNAKLDDREFAKNTQSRIDELLSYGVLDEWYVRKFYEDEYDPDAN